MRGLVAGVWPGPRRPALQLAAASNSKQPRPSNLHFQLHTLQPVRNPHEDHLERCLPPTQPPPIPPQTKALETWAFPATYPLTYLQKWRFSNRIIPTGSLAETFFNFPEDLTSRSRSDCRIHGILKSSVGDGNKSHGIHVWYKLLTFTHVTFQ